MAGKYELQVAHKADSQDICFVPKGNYADIIEKLKPNASAPGDIMHIDGRKLGRHDGIIHFTVGQRKGLKIASEAPLYVVSLDAKSNCVLVGPREALLTRKIPLRDFNWLGDAMKCDGLDVFARVRSTRPPCEAKLFIRPLSSPLIPAQAGIQLDPRYYNSDISELCINNATSGNPDVDGGERDLERFGEVYVELLNGEEGVAPGQACVLYENLEPEARVLGGGFIRKAAQQAVLPHVQAHESTLAL